MVTISRSGIQLKLCAVDLFPFAIQALHVATLERLSGMSGLSRPGTLTELAALLEGATVPLYFDPVYLFRLGVDGTAGVQEDTAGLACSV